MKPTLHSFMRVQPRKDGVYVSFHHALFYWSPALLLGLGLAALIMGGVYVKSASLQVPNSELVTVMVCVIVGILFVRAGWRLFTGTRAWVVRPGQLVVVRRSGKRVVADAGKIVKLSWNVVGSTEDARSNETQIYEIVAIMRQSNNIVLLDGVPDYLYPEIGARLLKWLGVEHLAGISGAVPPR